MEHIYALGIKCILYVQKHIKELDWFMESMNYFDNPYNVIEYMVPLASAVDTVLGAQLLFSVAFGNWATTMLKWMLAEDRPYWWVRETMYYDEASRPVLRQSAYTCETSPGSPSGHCATAATVYLLSNMWVTSVMNDVGATDYQSFYEWLPHKIIYFFVVMNSALARMHAGAHFPHQCLLGALLGSLLSPAVCLGVTYPYLFGDLDPQAVRRKMLKHVLMAVFAGVSAVALGVCYVALGADIHWGTRLAFRWCESVENINVKATPVFSVTQAVGSLLGWALFVTPEITKFRHNAANRNNGFFIVATTLALCFFHYLQEIIPSRRVPFYLTHFVLSVLKPYVYLQLFPKLSLYFTNTPAPVNGRRANERANRARRVQGAGAG